MTSVKPPPDRLYGRITGKKLRPRQEWLLEHFLPRLSWPQIPFAPTVTEIPPGNSTSASYDVIHIDWLTGRARQETQQVQ